MRMLLRVSLPAEAGNAAVKAGTVGPTIEQILADLKPEAVYFYLDDNSQRSCSVVFDMQDSSQLIEVAEPWLIAFNAKVSCRPVMSKEDFAKVGPQLAEAARRHGK